MDNKRTCTACVLPETRSMPLDETGRCPLCNSHDRLRHIVKPPDAAALQVLFDKARRQGRGRKFDCVVAWSGGRDSTFLLHQLVTKHGLRCAAVFGRTPFTPPEITDNVHRIAAALGVELVELATPANHLEIAGYCIDAYLRGGPPILINLACAPCKFVNREIFRQARRLHVSTVIYGGNRYEYFPSGPASVDLPDEDRYSLLNMARDNAVRLFRGIRILVASPALLRHGLTFFKASVLYVNQYAVYLRVRYPDIDRFDYFHYADWDEKAVNAVLQQLGWRLPQGCVTSWRADCIFEAMKNTAFEQQLGFNYPQALYSNLIRAGKMTRQQAMDRLASEPVSQWRLHKSLEMCGLPPDAMD